MPCTTHVPDTDTRIVDDAGTQCAPAAVATRHSCGEPCDDAGSCGTCVTCDRCGGREMPDDTVHTVRGSTICDSCRQDCYWQCDSCDGWNRDGADCGNGCCSGDCDCSDCNDDLDDFDGRVHDASYKPEPMFRGTGPLYLGPEIEIETPSSDAAACARLAESFLGTLGYLKEDGSLTDGFEIVTHPMSYDWAIAHFPWQMLTELHRLGCSTPDNTGIHVHVSRAAFATTCHTYRWMKFIYRNQAQVTTLARRSSPGYAAFTDDDRRAVKHYVKGRCGHTRYRAINTQNDNTLELRIFASSLDPATVQAALGFAAASVEYTRDLTVRQITDGGWTWVAFVDWLGERPAYGPLLQELEALQCVC